MKVENKEIQITQFRRRFGGKISDNILSLFYDSYGYSIDSNIGRELISDILHIMNLLIGEIANGKKEKLAELSEFKRIATKWNKIIKEEKKKSDEDYEKEILSEDDEKLLIRGLGEKGAKDTATTLINLDRFYYAYKSEVGQSLLDDIETNINEGVKSIWGENVNGQLTSYNAYKVIKSYWNIKIRNRDKILKETKTIINKRSR